jgi:hypothetical protein
VPALNFLLHPVDQSARICPLALRLNRMNISFLLSVALLSGTAAAESCNLAMLVGEKSLSEFAQLSGMPADQLREKGNFEKVEFSCPVQSIVSDAFGYTAFISSQERIAYVYQYGGYFGVSNWYGPIPIQPAVAEQCISKKPIQCPMTIVIKEAK